VVLKEWCFPKITFNNAQQGLQARQIETPAAREEFLEVSLYSLTLEFSATSYANIEALLMAQR